jgi:hypothetical protein
MKVSQAAAILFFGLWMGYVCGLGSAFGRLEKIVPARVTNGSIHIYGNGQPVSVSGFFVDLQGQDGPAISIDNRMTAKGVRR